MSNFISNSFYYFFLKVQTFMLFFHYVVYNFITVIPSFVVYFGEITMYNL